MTAVRIIHTQAQAQAELDRLRAAQKASDTRRKERMLNDPIYREEVLQSRQTSRYQKRKTIENDPHHLDARKNADRKAKARKIARESQDVMEYEDVPQSYDTLFHMRIPENVNITFDFSVGINVLDQNNFLIDKLAITKNKLFFYVM